MSKRLSPGCRGGVRGRRDSQTQLPRINREGGLGKAAQTRLGIKKMSGSCVGLGFWHRCGIAVRNDPTFAGLKRVGSCMQTRMMASKLYLTVEEKEYSYTMSKPVAIVTGAASGIGLAVSKHLLSKGYRVVLADVNGQEGNQAASELGDDALFHKADVSVYAEQAALFQKAFTWGGDRLDFLAANAGIDDRQSLYETEEALDENGVPKPLNLKTIEVDLQAVFQGIWLFKHYARKSPNPKGKIVITSSAAGF